MAQIMRTPQLDRPGQPRDYLRERILQDRQEQTGGFVRQYENTQESRPTEDVDRGERPKPIRDNPRMTVKQVGSVMQATGAPQGDLASATDPSYDTIPFSQRPMPIVNTRPRDSETTMEEIERGRREAAILKRGDSRFKFKGRG